MRELSTEQMIATIAAATPFVVAQMGHPKLAVGIGAAVIAGEYIFAHTELDGAPAMPYTSREWLTVGIFAAGVAAAYFKPHWALAIGAGVLAIDVYRAGGFGSQLPGRTPPES